MEGNNTSDIKANLTYSSNAGQCDDADGLLAYACFYFGIHGYFSLILCCFGVPANIVNIIILTRKSMRSPINCILTGIAISDALTMLSVIPFAIHFYIMYGLERTPEKYTYGWSLFLAIHACLTITTHTISIWLGVCMSCVRYIYIKSMGIGKQNIDNRRAWILVVSVYILAIIAYIPFYCFIRVIPAQSCHDSNSTAPCQYGIQNLNLNKGVEKMSYLEAAAVWIFIILGKWVPCFLITTFGGLLLHTLHESKKRTKLLKGAQTDARLKQHKRTTIMLLAIILMYVIAEMPQSILLVVGMTVKGFFDSIYQLLADTIDILALINNSANFVMYCGMSRQFRDILCSYMCLYLPNKKDNMVYLSVRSTQTTRHDR